MTFSSVQNASHAAGAYSHKYMFMMVVFGYSASHAKQ